MTTIDVAAEVLGEILPILTAAVRVVGSAQSVNPQTVRLVIAGDGIPEGHVGCEVTKVWANGVLQMTVRFKPE